jgi:hypothetical protein
MPEQPTDPQPTDRTVTAPPRQDSRPAAQPAPEQTAQPRGRRSAQFAEEGLVGAVATDPDWERRRTEILHEYGQFRAVSPIFVGNALAYNPGDAVPASNVEAHDMLNLGLVERVPDSDSDGSATDPVAR